MTPDLDKRVKQGKITQTDIWKHKEEFFEQAAKSRKIWGDMSNEKQQALLSIVDRALVRMRDTIDTWVPDSLELVNGQFVEVTFRVLFTELDEEMRRREEVTDRTIARAAEELQQVLNEFND